jgi:hypothetical protein
MGVYASYVLPLTIVLIPMLWKRLYDLAPESQTRIAVLEADADLRSELVKVQREQNALMISAYRESLDTVRVAQARKALLLTETRAMPGQVRVSAFYDHELSRPL